jgi:hypothetical protein
MRKFDKIDLIVQTILVLIASGPLMFDLITFTMHESLLVTLFAGALLGIWQLMSCLINVIRRMPLLNWRIVHLGVTGVYIVILVIFSRLAGHYEPVWLVNSIFYLVILGLPTSIALFYYYITFRT